MKRLLLPILIFLTVMLPTGAQAAVGGSIVERLWDQAMSTTQNRMQERLPRTVEFFQDAERFFLNGTRDVTNLTAVREVYAAMRVAGLLLLGLCTVISLAQLTEAGLMGESANIIDWIKRFCVAAFMTMGSIHFYGLWIRVFNAMLDAFRVYLDTHWGERSDPTAIYSGLVALMDPGSSLAVLIFSVVLLVVLLILWFLIGGIRVAELAIAVVIAPLVWPVYLIPSLEDIPKTALRSFLGLNATLLIIVAIMRLAVRLDMGGGQFNTVWNFVPSISLLIMSVFLPTIVKRLTGQGNTGRGLLMTAAYALAGLKGLSLMSRQGSGGQGPSSGPPTQSNLPPTPDGPSAYPVAPLSSPPGVSGTAPGASRPPHSADGWGNAPRQFQAGTVVGRQALEAPFEIASAADVIIDMRQSKPGSNQFDTVDAVSAWMDGRRRVFRDPDTGPKNTGGDRS
ncbi:MAG TPA: hypothetical protein VD973_29435 [Symbiobacteriaceae bacterium]|nr:hypothetical protein [Symbiobacteriaceae bacterium]